MSLPQPVVEDGVVPEPVLPDYRGPNLAGVVPALAMAPGRRPEWVPAPVAGARQVVLFVIDGLGWLQLQERGHLAPTLAAMTGGPITSVVPTTTATALTSLTVGAPPAAHGLVGYRFVVPGPTGEEVLNVLRWRTPSGDAKEFAVPEIVQPLTPFGGRAVPIVSNRQYAGSPFSKAHQRDTPLAGVWMPSSLVVEVRRLLAAGEPFVYVYYEGLDKVAHFHGFGEHYEAELVTVDRLVADLLDVLPAGGALAVTADHGMVEVGPRAKTLAPGIMEGVSLLSGEARFRWLHSRHGTAGARHLAQAVAGTYGSEAWVVSREQVEDEGWFGGPFRPEVRARLGDVALVPHEPVAYLDPADKLDSRLVGRHGSVTPEEMLVPLIGQQGRLGL
ncbi:MAG: alkaline phosphatase family protein [Acidimicrobiales bacterium]